MFGKGRDFLLFGTVESIWILQPRNMLEVCSITIGQILYLAGLDSTERVSEQEQRDIKYQKMKFWKRLLVVLSPHMYCGACSSMAN